MVVIYTEVEAPVLRQRYFCSNYTKAIAQSIPYHCLIILRCKSIVKYFAFEKRPNKENTSRMLVTECYATDELNDFDRYNWLFITDLEDAVQFAKSVDELNESWIRIICRYSGSIEAARTNARADGRQLISAAAPHKRIEYAADDSDDYNENDEYEDPYDYEDIDDNMGFILL